MPKTFYALLHTHTHTYAYAYFSTHCETTTEMIIKYVFGYACCWRTLCHVGRIIKKRDKKKTKNK